jgi:hypothetical protein
MSVNLAGYTTDVELPSELHGNELPSWPKSLEPQQSAWPSVIKAHVNERPPCRERGVPGPKRMKFGPWLLVLPLIPPCGDPQHAMVATPVIVHVWKPPVDTSETGSSRSVTSARG